MTLLEVVVALAVAVGLVGVLIPLLPGTLLVAVAVLVWAVDTGGAGAWTATGIALTLLAVGALLKYLVPGRRLTAAGVPTRTLWIGGLLGVVGFFVVPVLGLVLGFVLGVYVAERARLGGTEAGRSTVAALRAVGLSLAIELLAGLLAALAWAVGVVVT